MLIKPEVNQCPFDDSVDHAIISYYLHIQRFEPPQFAPPTSLLGLAGSPLTNPLVLDGPGEGYGKLAACHVNPANRFTNPDGSIKINTFSATE
jgi:hypothetical protein